ncbi:rho GTPase-activating protein 27-like [Melanotaenia boesemani]|uniref:rho GTPase-activating protein 27-like n=1 Tax=Melanotaenia boesemani TaxID=1250792 RepID=UPI001C0415AD|nr:rho GTPase-activating protein 27-like [Melanotaenia boesemani]
MAAKSSLISRGLGLVLVEFEYEYEGRDGELVSIKPNERYVLLAKTNDHWWQVQNDHSSKPFYIPANYVKELPGNFPCPLDFAEPPCPKPVPHPVVAPVPVPVPVPVPKPLEEPRSKPGDEVTIRLRPDASTMFHKKENRMSTFGFPLDLQDKAAQVPSSRHSSNLPAGSAEAGSTVSSRTANMADMRKQSPLEDHRDSEKPRVPSFSPADPQSISRPQPIPVEMPVVPPHNNLRNMSLSPKEIPAKSENEEEEEMVEEDMSIEESSEEEESQREEDSNHIYESIQDLNLDLDALVGGNQCPGPPPESAPAPPPLPTTKENCSLGPNLPIYANISLKKSQISVSGLPCSPPSDSASSLSGHTLSTSPSSSMISSASPLSPQDGWQVHTDRNSGNFFYYHPATRQTTWSDPRSPGDLDLPSPPSPASLQDSVWEQLLDQDTGRIYYHNPKTGATSWTLPDQLSPPSTPGSRRPDNSPPPLPAEDYPMDPHEEDTVFTVGLAPRAELDPKDLDQQRREQEQRLLGNGVSEEGAAPQIRILRHSIAEDTFSPGHRRTGSDITDGTSKRQSPDGPQFSNRFRLRRNLSNQSTGSHRQHQGHPLEKAGVVNKTKVVDNGKKIRKNWTQSWTVLHDGILTFHKDPKFALTGNAIVPEYTVELRGGSVCRASKDKSSKKNVLELRTRQGCEYLIQNDTDSIISDWLKAIQDTIRQLDQENLSEEDDEAAHSSSSGLESEHRQVRSKLRRFLQRRPTLQSVKERGYIRDNVFGCHLDTLCHRENTTIPKFVEKCIRTVERRGLKVDGIYRVSGNLAVIQKLRHKADHEEQLDLEDGAWEEIHVITGALKLFFRELPEPLFPFSCFDKFIAAIQVPDYNLRVSYMKDLVRSLPLPNHNTMELLFKHLRRVIEHKDSNRMSVQSVAIVFGPTLLWPQTESANMTVHMVFQSQIVELMLKEFQTIFSEN